MSIAPAKALTTSRGVVATLVTLGPHACLRHQAWERPPIPPQAGELAAGRAPQDWISRSRLDPRDQFRLPLLVLRMIPDLSVARPVRLDMEWVVAHTQSQAWICSSARCVVLPNNVFQTTLVATSSATVAPATATTMKTVAVQSQHRVRHSACDSVNRRSLCRSTSNLISFTNPGCVHMKVLAAHTHTHTHTRARARARARHRSRASYVRVGHHGRQTCQRNASAVPDRPPIFQHAPWLLCDFVAQRHGARVGEFQSRARLVVAVEGAVLALCGVSAARKRARGSAYLRRAPLEVTFAHEPPTHQYAGPSSHPRTLCGSVCDTSTHATTRATPMPKLRSPMVSCAGRRVRAHLRHAATATCTSPPALPKLLHATL